jgi:hypothetical protein
MGSGRIIEAMTVTASGYNGTVTFDGNVIRIKRNALGTLTFGRSEKLIQLRQVTAVEWKQPKWYDVGHIAFTTAGDNRPKEVSKYENAVVVKPHQAEQFAELKRAVEDALNSLNQL